MNDIRRERETVAAVVALAVILALLGAGTFLHPAERTSDSALNCTGASCERTTVTERPESCNSWGPWEPVSNLSCNWTTEGAAAVSLITDPGNYITAPRASEEYNVSIVRHSWNGGGPWDLEIISADEWLFTLDAGAIVRYHDGDFRIIHSVDAVPYGTSGLLGMEPVVKDGSLSAIYVVYAYERRSDNQVSLRLSRLDVRDYLVENETVLLDDIPGAKHHSGGRLEFGPDGLLYLTTGDADELIQVQNSSRLNGKILRIHRNGSIPDSNPFENAVLSLGHRNPQGLAWSPDGQLYATEHGQNRYDEVNRITAGSNYGWPVMECDRRKNSVTDIPGNRTPVRCFKNWTLAPSGATFVDDPGHPWHGDMFIAGLRGNHLHRLEFDDGEVRSSEIFYIPTGGVTDNNPLRDVEYHDGSLYVLGDLTRIMILTP